MSAATPLDFAVRTFLLRKNLIAIPFELAGAAAALFVAMDLIPALLYLMVGDLVGDQIGRRVAHATGILDGFAAQEIRAFRDSRPRLVVSLFVLVPLVVALAAWQMELEPNQIVAWAGIAWSAATFGYRYFAFLKGRSQAKNA